MAKKKLNPSFLMRKQFFRYSCIIFNGRKQTIFYYFGSLRKHNFLKNKFFSNE